MTPLLLSLQRADKVNLVNSDFVLLGAIDRVEEGDTSLKVSVPTETGLRLLKKKYLVIVSEYADRPNNPPIPVLIIKI